MTSILTLIRNIFKLKLVYIITVPNINGNTKAVTEFIKAAGLKGDYVVLEDVKHGVRVKKKWLL